MRILFAALFILVGCASAPVEFRALKAESVSYSIGKNEVRSAGEAMAVEERLVYYNAQVAVKGYRPPPQMGSEYPAIPRGMAFRPWGMLSNGGTLYTNHELRPSSGGRPVGWDYCIAVDALGRPYGDAACALGIVRSWPGGPEDFLETRPVYMEETLRRELLYNGRSGATILVAYREFRGGAASPALSQELAYDLSASSIIRFRGMEIEVLEATNSRISYIVRSGMDEGGRAPARAQGRAPGAI